MGDTRDPETLWQLIGPWILPALCGALMPLLSVNLAAGAWLTRPTPTALRLGGVSLLLLIVTMTTHYAPFTEAGRDVGVAAERDASGPMCSPERTRLTPNKDCSSPTGISIPWEFVTYGWRRWRRM
jgi:hypothetical protein